MDIVFSEIHNKTSQIAFVDECGEYREQIEPTMDTPKTEDKPQVIDMTNYNPEIKPFNPDYVHIYDPEGDKPDPSTKSVETLLKEEQEYKEQINNLTEEEKEVQFKKDLVKRIRCIVCHKMGKHPLINICDLNPIERKKYIQEVTETFNKAINDKELQEEITKEFNVLVVEVILANDADISRYLVYSK